MRLRHLFLVGIALLLLQAGTALADGGPIMPLAQVQPGMDCIGETVIQGTTISTFNVHVVDIVHDPQQGPRILVNVSGPAVAGTGVAEGFSGSPVLCDDGTGTMRNVGAISESIGQYGNDLVLVTPIEQMLGEPVNPPVWAPRLKVRTHPLMGPLTIGGLSPGLFSLVQRAGQRAGRTILAAPSQSDLSFPVQPLVPGASVAVSYAQGAIPAGAIGTVTYRDGNTVYAFGHPLDGAGRRSLLLQDAYVYDVVGDPSTDTSGSYKLAAPGHTEGTLTSDTPNAVVGTVGGAPALVPVDVFARDQDTGHSETLRTQVADETDIGMPYGSSLVTLIGPLAVAQAASDVYNGAPANESGTMCLHVEIREIHGPLGFCNRYVSSGIPGGAGIAPPALALAASSDATTALGLIDSVQFAKLHITHVGVRIYAERGLRQATIVAAHVPARVTAGKRALVRLTVRVYRGPLRTITIPIQVPADAKGTVTARITSASQLVSSQGLAGALTQALSVSIGGLFGGGGGAPPSTPAQLRKAVAAVAVYDGLELRVPHHNSQRVYRNTNLLVLGSARVALHVAH